MSHRSPIVRIAYRVILLVLIPLFSGGGGCVAQDAPLLMQAQRNDAGQVVLREDGHAILQYNFHTVEPDAAYLDRLAPGNRRYAVPRSDYIHPLFGPRGEEITHDWSLDHPHHRGVYWAWPEVGFGSQTADLHALQGVFSRPVGDLVLENGQRAASVRASNLWLWEDETPIVFERVTITAHAATENGVRAVDLELRFEALRQGVTLARRHTDAYGGLNTRLASASGLVTRHVADAEDASPRRAWSVGCGTWQPNTPSDDDAIVTLAILEHPDNPDYPGDFIEYPELPWFQPTFPRAGTRYTLAEGKPLVLRYRLLIGAGELTQEELEQAWDQWVGLTP